MQVDANTIRAVLVSFVSGDAELMDMLKVIAPRPKPADIIAPAAVPGTSIGSQAESRTDLIAAAFAALGGSGKGHLTAVEMLPFARHTGFDGTDVEWRKEFEMLLKDCGATAGVTKATFEKLVNDTSDAGCYCSDAELRSLLSKLPKPERDQLPPKQERDQLPQPTLRAGLIQQLGAEDRREDMQSALCPENCDEGRPTCSQARWLHALLQLPNGCLYNLSKHISKRLCDGVRAQRKLAIADLATLRSRGPQVNPMVHRLTIGGTERGKDLETSPHTLGVQLLSAYLYLSF